MKRGKLLPWQFDISQCKIEFALIEGTKEDKGFGTVFMNVTFPDGRWIAFKSVESMRVEMYAKPESQLNNSNLTKQEDKK